MAEITMDDCKIDTRSLKHSLAKACDAVSISAKAAGKIIGEWTTTSSSIPVDYAWVTATDGITISYSEGKETQNQEIVDLETKIEDAIDNIVMLIQTAKPHDEESLRDRIRCGIEEAFRIDEKPEPEVIEAFVWDTPFESTTSSSTSVTFALDSDSTSETDSSIIASYGSTASEVYSNPFTSLSTIVDDTVKKYTKEYTKEITKEVEKEFRKEVLKPYISLNSLEQPP